MPLSGRPWSTAGGARGRRPRTTGLQRVLAHRNRYDLGLLNGDTGVVVGAVNRRLVVDVDGGRRVEVPVDYLASGHLGHAYARTIHKAQGMTCDRALLLGTETLFAEAGYTGLSRGRDHNHLYVVASADDFVAGPDDPLARVQHALAHAAGGVGDDAAISARSPSSVPADRSRPAAPRPASGLGHSPPSCPRSRPISWRPPSRNAARSAR